MHFSLIETLDYDYQMIGVKLGSEKSLPVTGRKQDIKAAILTPSYSKST